MKLKKPFSDGTTHIVFTPLEFIEKLSALLPKLRVHLIRYAGAFARHAKIRPDVLVKARLGEDPDNGKSTPPAESKTPSEKSRNLARLLKKVFNIDVESCHACGGKNVKIAVAAARAPPQSHFDW